MNNLENITKEMRKLVKLIDERQANYEKLFEQETLRLEREKLICRAWDEEIQVQITCLDKLFEEELLQSAVSDSKVPFLKSEWGMSFTAYDDNKEEDVQKLISSIHEKNRLLKEAEILYHERVRKIIEANETQKHSS